MKCLKWPNQATNIHLIDFRSQQFLLRHITKRLWKGDDIILRLPYRIEKWLIENESRDTKPEYELLHDSTSHLISKPLLFRTNIINTVFWMIREDSKWWHPSLSSDRLIRWATSHRNTPNSRFFQFSTTYFVKLNKCYNLLSSDLI